MEPPAPPLVGVELNPGPETSLSHAVSTESDPDGEVAAANSLPLDLIRHVFGFLSLPELALATTVSYLWRQEVLYMSDSIDATVQLQLPTDGLTSYLEEVCHSWLARRHVGELICGRIPGCLCRQANSISRELMRDSISQLWALKSLEFEADPTIDPQPYVFSETLSSLSVHIHPSSSHATVLQLMTSVAESWQLRSLILTVPRLTPTHLALSPLVNMKYLIRLEVRNEQQLALTDDDARMFRRMRCLRWLELPSITQEQLRLLSELLPDCPPSSLDLLSIPPPPLVDDNLIVNLPALRQLQLGSARSLAPAVPRRLYWLTQLGALRTLHYHNTRQLSADAVIATLMLVTPALTVLRIIHVMDLTAAHCEQLCSRFTQLRSLHLVRCALPSLLPFHEARALTCLEVKWRDLNRDCQHYTSADVDALKCALPLLTFFEETRMPWEIPGLAAAMELHWAEHGMDIDKEEEEEEEAKDEEEEAKADVLQPIGVDVDSSACSASDNGLLTQHDLVDITPPAPPLVGIESNPGPIGGSTQLQLRISPSVALPNRSDSHLYDASDSEGDAPMIGDTAHKKSVKPPVAASSRVQRSALRSSLLQAASAAAASVSQARRQPRVTALSPHVDLMLPLQGQSFVLDYNYASTTGSAPSDSVDQDASDSDPLREGLLTLGAKIVNTVQTGVTAVIYDPSNPQTDSQREDAFLLSVPLRPYQSVWLEVKAALKAREPGLPRIEIRDREGRYDTIVYEFPMMMRTPAATSAAASSSSSSSAATVCPVHTGLSNTSELVHTIPLLDWNAPGDGSPFIVGERHVSSRSTRGPLKPLRERAHLCEICTNAYKTTVMVNDIQAHFNSPKHQILFDRRGYWDSVDLLNIRMERVRKKMVDYEEYLPIMMKLEEEKYLAQAEAELMAEMAAEAEATRSAAASAPARTHTTAAHATPPVASTHQSCVAMDVDNGTVTAAIQGDIDGAAVTPMMHSSTESVSQPLSPTALIVDAAAVPPAADSAAAPTSTSSPLDESQQLKRKSDSSTQSPKRQRTAIDTSSLALSTSQVESDADGSADVEAPCIGDSAASSESSPAPCVSTSLSPPAELDAQHSEPHSPLFLQPSSDSDDKMEAAPPVSESAPPTLTLSTCDLPVTPCDESALVSSDSAAASSTPPRIFLTSGQIPLPLADLTRIAAAVAAMSGALLDLADPTSVRSDAEWSRVTHIVSGSATLKRTAKLLTAYATCQHILTRQWLDECVRQRRWVDEQPYVLSDAASESKWKFSLAARTRGLRFLHGFRIHCSPAIHAAMPALPAIITAAGGCFSRHYVAEQHSVESTHRQRRLILATSVDEDSQWRRRHADDGYELHTQELILTGVLQQRLDITQHKLSRLVDSSTSASVNMEPPDTSTSESTESDADEWSEAAASGMQLCFVDESNFAADFASSSSFHPDMGQVLLVWSTPSRQIHSHNSSSSLLTSGSEAAQSSPSVSSSRDDSLSGESISIAACAATACAATGSAATVDSSVGSVGAGFAMGSGSACDASGSVAASLSASVHSFGASTRGGSSVSVCMRPPSDWL
jgi:hypothetical protein